MSRPNRRAAGRSPRPGRPKPTPRPGPRAAVEPVPLEKNRARGVLLGLYMFAAGFAVAAVDLFVWGVARPQYLVAVTVGFVGIGVTGFFLSRGTVPRPEEAIWSRAGLRALTRPLGWPAIPVIVVFYGLLAVGVVGNFLVPLFFRR